MDVAFLGLGIMGSRMAAHLVADHTVTVWTRTPGKAQAWAQDHGARAAATPAEAAAAADVVITMLVDGAQVRDVVLERDDAVAAGARPGALVVDCSTIAPTDSRTVAAALAERGLRFADAPVTGSSPKAADGTLTFICGAAAEDLAAIRPLLDAMGSVVVHAGPVGSGEAVKLVNNAVAAANAATLAQALIVADALGLDLDALAQVLAAGSGGSVVSSLKTAPMRAHDWTTLFKAEHMLKDVRLCLEEAEGAGVPFPAAADAREALVATCGRGLGDADFAALLEAFEGLAGHRI